MAKFNEVLKQMVEGAGLSASDTTIKNLLDNPELAKIELDEAVSTKLTAPRMTMEAAKNNPDLHRHFTGTILNTVDKKVYDSAKDLGFTDEEINDLKGISSSYDRIIALSKKAQALEGKKADSGKKDKDALSKEIEKLNADILTLKESYNKEKESLLSGFENEKTNWKLDSVYSQFLPKMDQTKSAKVNMITTRTLVNDELQKKGLKIVNKEGNLSIVTNDNLEYHDNNVKVGVEDFVSKVLANEKLLTASSTTGSNGNSTKRAEPKPGNNSLKVDSYIDALVDDVK